MTAPNRSRDPRKSKATVRWADIPSCPGYMASDDGRILGKWGRELRRQVNEDGYYWLCLTVNGKRRKVRVNRLVCEAFNGPPPGDGYDAAHLDCQPSNNRADNLEWQTHKKNQSHPITRQRMSDAQKELWGDPEFRSRMSSILASPEFIARNKASKRAGALHRHRSFNRRAMRAAREWQWITQAELAAAIGCRSVTISQWERGSKTPTQKHLLSLAAALDMDVADLLRSAK